MDNNITVEELRLKQHCKLQFLKEHTVLSQLLTFFLHALVVVCFMFTYIMAMKMSWITMCLFGFMGSVFFVVLSWWNIYVYDVEGD